MDILERLEIIATTTSAEWPTASIDWEYREAVKEIKRLRLIEEAAKNLVKQKGRHNTEIAYMRLEAALSPNVEFSGAQRSGASAATEG